MRWCGHGAAVGLLLAAAGIVPTTLELGARPRRRCAGPSERYGTGVAVRVTRSVCLQVGHGCLSQRPGDPQPGPQAQIPSRDSASWSRLPLAAAKRPEPSSQAQIPSRALTAIRSRAKRRSQWLSESAEAQPQPAPPGRTWVEAGSDWNKTGLERLPLAKPAPGLTLLTASESAQAYCQAQVVLCAKG